MWPLPPPFLFLGCFSFGCLFSGWVGLLSSSLQSICTPDSHRWTTNPPAFPFKSLVFSSIMANVLFNPLWYSLAPKCYTSGLDSCFKLGTHCPFVLRIDLSDACLCHPARPDRVLRVSPPAVVCRLLTAEASVKLLVDHLWLLCVSLPLGVQFVSAAPKSSRL